jgi:RimJ/RimL family protein N-acetyltransferase
MAETTDQENIVAVLEREPLRNIVLLKHLEAFPDHTRAHQITSPAGTATLVLLDVSASAYDRRTYPAARFAALISSDHPNLTRRLLDFVPSAVGVVFKLSSEADRDVVASMSALERTTSVLSFTTTSTFARDHAVRVGATPGDAVFQLFEAQDHARSWLEPLLRADRAVTSVLDQQGEPAAVCFAFENYKRVWEIGGVFTQPDVRGQGLAARVVGTMLAVLAKRRLIPRYQVHDDNTPSIRLARAIGLEQFLTITHYLRQPCDAAVAKP